MNTDSNAWRWLRLSLLALIGCAALSAFRAAPQAAQQAGQSTTQQTTTASASEAGKRIFSGSCSNSYCHGNEGVGGGGPKLRGRSFTAGHLLKVITEGIPGTSMPSFKNSLSKAQIADVTAYVLSFSPNSAQAKSNPMLDAHAGAPAEADPKSVAAVTPPKTPSASATTNEALDLRGDARLGEAIFFDSSDNQSCRACHTVQGRGGKLGPELSTLAGRPPREILLSIVAPHTSVSDRYATLALTTREGEKFTGVKRDETEQSIRLYDTSSFPPVSRSFLKSEITKTETLKQSATPHDFAAKYTLKQLLDLISFLKTAESGAPVSIGLKEIF